MASSKIQEPDDVPVWSQDPEVNLMTIILLSRFQAEQRLSRRWPVGGRTMASQVSVSSGSDPPCVASCGTSASCASSSQAASTGKSGLD